MLSLQYCLAAALPYSSEFHSAVEPSLFEVEGSNFLCSNKKPELEGPGFVFSLVGHEGFEPSTNGLRVSI